jgi:L-2-hydroxyglutarate oxidase LhgO
LDILYNKQIKQRIIFMIKSDFLVIGAGIVGLSMADALRNRYPRCSISVIEKEADVAMHASGRNSGVLHAGFYYSADSLKARFTREGNQRMKEFCRRHNLHLNECGKVVVASDENELDTLHELHERGLKNGVDIKLVDKEELEALEPNARTCRYALHSPSTATVNPGEVCRKLRDKVVENGCCYLIEGMHI